MAFMNGNFVRNDDSTMNDDYPLNMRLLLERGSRIQPNNEVITILQNGFHRITYNQIRIQSTKLADALTNIYGIKVGDVVSSFMWNTSRHLTLYYTMACMGVILNPLNIRLHAKELTYIIGHSQPKVVFIDADLLPLFGKVSLSKLATVKTLVVCGYNMKSNNWKSNINMNTIDFDVLVSKGMNSFNWPLLDERNGTLLNYTSGTTGNPKGVMNSQRSSFLQTLASTHGLSGTDCVLQLPPLFHAGGWNIPYCCLALGIKNLMPYNCRDFSKMLDWGLHERMTLMWGVPTIIQGMVHAFKTNPTKYAPLKECLRNIGVGGTCPPESIITWLWNNWNIKVSQGWGMTECLPGSGSAREQVRDDLNKSDKEKSLNCTRQGRFSVLLETKLVDAENMDIIVEHNGNDIGELLIKGPCVTKEYYKNKALNKFKDGYLKTGDIVTITSDDVMKIKDRSKDLIKSGGEWISSADMENFVMQLDEVELACVVGWHHPKWDERPIVLVQCHKGKSISKDKILKYIGTKYAKFQIPDDVLFKNIPLTGTGKISKKTVRQILKDIKYVLPSLRGKQSKL